MSEIREIAESRVQSRRQSRQLRRTSSFFNIPSQEELKDDSFRGKCTQMIHSFKFQVSFGVNKVLLGLIPKGNIKYVSHHGTRVPFSVNRFPEFA